MMILPHIVVRDPCLVYGLVVQIIVDAFLNRRKAFHCAEDTDAGKLAIDFREEIFIVEKNVLKCVIASVAFHKLIEAIVDALVVLSIRHGEQVQDQRRQTRLKKGKLF